MVVKAKQLSVSIVLPNWNGAQLLVRNLPFVIASALGAEIIVSDDASTDESVKLLHEKFPNVILVENRHQQGFAGNVNSGVARASGDIVVLLNTDVRPEKNFLVPLLSHFSDPMVAAVGCLEKSYDIGGVVLRGRGVAHWTRGYFIHSKGEVDKSDTAWVAGGSSAFRKSIWNMLGGMDTLYNPFYWEDIDLSYQILKAGYRIVFEKKSVVGHYHEEGKIKTSFTPSQIKRIVYRNQFMFLWKNISDTSILLEHCFWTPIRLVQALLRRDRLMIVGYISAMINLPHIWSSRVRASKHWNRNDKTTLPVTD